MASVFLSYDRDDSDRARHLARALEKAGHQVWWDPHVRGGAQFSKVIEEALRAADVVVVLWSQNAVDSAWVRDEAAAGRDSGRLVPVRLDATEPPLGFRQFQTIDLSRWKGRGSHVGLRTLLSDIGSTARSNDAPQSEPRTAVPATISRARFAFPRRALLPAAGVALVLALGSGLYWRSATRGDDSPLVSVAAADDSTLSRSLAHNVLVNLGSVAGSSSTNFRLTDEGSNRRPDLRLSVGGVAEGGKTQVTVALASAGQEGVLWSRQIGQQALQRANLEQAAAFAAMSAIACAADDSNGSFRRLGASGTRAYLNACVSLGEGDEAQPLVGVFRNATQAAPEFAAGWARLLSAEVYLLRTLRDVGAPTDALTTTLTNDIRTATEIDPDMPAAAVAKAELAPPRSFLRIISTIDTAKSAHPDDAAVLAERAGQLLSVGRVNEALADAQRAAELKPYSPAVRVNYITALMMAGGIDKSFVELATAKQLWPDAPVVVDADHALNLRYGDFEKTWRSAGYPIDGGITGYFHVLRSPTDANIDAWIDLARTHKMLLPHRQFILQALGPLNRVDELYAFLDQWPMEQDLAGRTDVLFRPWLAEVRRDPRFMRLAQRAGLLDYWRTSGEWPDFCAEPDMPYDCKKEAAKLRA